MRSGEYADIEAGQVPAYQRYFIEIVNSISVDNLDKKHRGLRHDPKQDHRDQQLLRHICERALAESQVRTSHLVRLLERYVAADSVTRARNKHKWVGRVVSGKIAEAVMHEPPQPGPTLTGSES